MPNLPPLRHWQRLAIETYLAKSSPDFLCVATPGAGKTRFASEIATREFSAERVNFLIVVTPSKRLKWQWMNALHAAGLSINPEFERADFSRMLAPDMQGIAATYSQIAGSQDLFRALTSRRPTLVVLDELHHCGTDRSWGEGAREAFEPCVKRLGLSGTPWRTQPEPIPFVRYVDGESVADFTWGYEDALTAKPPDCRPVFFPRTGGWMHWSPRPGETRTADFDEELSEVDANRRLRTAIDPENNLIREMLRSAHDRLVEMREVEQDHDAAGLVICERTTGADKTAALLRGMGADVEVVHDDIQDAHERIERFARTSRQWLVSVAMVSEGVDIPRLRIGVFATVKTTELFFRQAVGRLVRYEPGDEAQDALMYIPDDPRLRKHAEKIKREVAHVLDEETERLTREGTGDREPSQVVSLSAEGYDRGILAGDETWTPEDIERAERVKMLNPETAHLPTRLVLQIERASRTIPPRPAEAPSLFEAPPRHERKRALKNANSKIAKRIALTHAVDFAEVNAVLNRSVSIRSVREATEDELQARLAVGQKWLETGTSPVRRYG